MENNTCAEVCAIFSFVCKLLFPCKVPSLVMEALAPIKLALFSLLNRVGWEWLVSQSLPLSFSQYAVQERLSQNEPLLWTGSSSQASPQIPFLDLAERRHLRLGSCHPKLLKETRHLSLIQIWTCSQYLLTLGFNQHAVDQPPTQN